MEKKLEIIESSSEVSKDKLWLKPIKEGMSLLHYGSNGWEHILGKSSSTGTPTPTPTPTLKDIPDSVFKNLSGEDILRISNLLRESNNNLSLEERFLYLNSNNLTFSDKPPKLYSNYVDINLSGKKSYKFGNLTIDSAKLLPIFKKGDIIRLYEQNPDFYIKFKIDINLSVFKSIYKILNVYDGINSFLDYWVEKDTTGTYTIETYILNNEEVTTKKVLLSDVIEIIDKSVENGAVEVQDGFRPRLKGDEIFIDKNINVLEYYKMRSPNNLIQENSSYILLLNKNREIEKYEVINESGCTLKDIYSILKIQKQGGDVCEYTADNGKGVLQFIDVIPEYKISCFILNYDQSINEVVGTNLKSGDILIFDTLPHEKFYCTDTKNISLTHLRDVCNYVESLAYYHNINETLITKYYPPYENYKHNGIINNKICIEARKKAEQAKQKVLIALENLNNNLDRDFDSIDSDIITTGQIK